MLVLFLLIIYVADFCQGKAFPEAEKDRGKRSYSHVPSAGIHQTYDSQSNAEHWMKGNFYQPQVDGQPIYVPSLDQQGSYNEFLDAYYKAYAPAWNLATPVAYTYSTKSAYENAEKNGVKDSSIKEKYSLPMSQFASDYAPESEDYDSEIDKTIADQFSNEGTDEFSHENADVTTSESDSNEFKEKIALEALKSQLPKTDPKDYNNYDEPVIKKRVKQKPKAKENQYEPPIIKTKQKPKAKDQYEPAVAKTVKQKPKAKDQYEPAVAKTVKQKPKAKDQYEPAVAKTVKQKPKAKDQYEPAVAKTVEQKPKAKDQYEPAVAKTVKQKPKAKDQYEPAVAKTVKQKPKAKDQYEPAVVKTVKQKPKAKDQYETADVKTVKQGQLSVETITNDDLEAPGSEDYADPEIIDKTIEAEFSNEDADEFNHGNSDVATSESDEFEDQILDSLKKSELPKAKPDYKQQDVPAISKPVKRKPSSVKKQAPKKYSTPKPKLQLEKDYEKPVNKIEKSKPNKKVQSSSKYGDPKSPIRKSKGKRRKQYSKPKSSGEAGENTSLKTVAAIPDELSKKDGELYPSQNIEIKDKSVKTDSQYDLVNIKATVKQNAKYEPIKPDAKDTKLDDVLKRQLNVRNESLSENDNGIGTDNPLENEPNNASSLDMTESQFPGIKLGNAEPPKPENDQNSQGQANVVKPDSMINTDDLRALSSMNSNIWSMLFNPNAEQNRLKQKRCITRSNETGFCTYIQNCEVPHIATSLEQLLNNACVIDDIFIGVCCPEFPVETVQVQWDQMPSDFDNQIEDEFGNNAEGELIKSWCHGYEESLTNLLISFSLADCGVRSNEASELQSWPWKAPLVSMSNGKIFCGGVVVSKDHILTAAHCTTKIPKNQILVRLGQYDDGSGDDYAVVEIKRHAQYNPKTMQNDVALLKLGLRIMNDAHIGIVCLPEEDDKSEHDGETATLLGWRGIFGTKSRDPEFLKVIPNKECEKKLGMKVLDNTLCTETRKESERTCNADSGAPLVIEHDGKYEVIGILSWNRNDCDQRFPSTFSRVSSYTAWIKNHIA